MRQSLYFAFSLLAFFICLQSSAQVNLISDSITAPSGTAISYTHPADEVPPSGLINYQRTFIPLLPVPDTTYDLFKWSPSAAFQYEATATTTYLNGFGKSIQSILRGSRTATTPDLITPYDNRPTDTSRSFLPYANGNTSNHFQTSPFTDQASFYNGLFSSEQNTAYSKTITNSLQSLHNATSYSPGLSFVGDSRGTTTTATLNTGSEGITIYNVTATGPVSAGTYGAQQLIVKTGNGQNSTKTISYYDKNNRLICFDDVNGLENKYTYYVYNDLGKLCYVFTPAAVATGINTTTLANLTFQYSYNGYGSAIASKDPSETSSSYNVYDSKNRVVLSQTPNLAAINKYSFTFYDSRDRPMIIGLMDDSNTPDVWQGWIDNPASTTVSPGTFLYYTINGKDDYTGTPNCEYDQVNYYDNYQNFINTFYNGDSVNYLAGNGAITPVPFMFTNGLLTGSKTRIKDGGITTTTDNWTTSVYFYDQQGRVIQTQTINPWNTAGYVPSPGLPRSYKKDILTTEYNFAGEKVLEILHYNDSPNAVKPSTKVMNKYEYDINNNGRLMDVQQNIDDGAWRPITAYTYNSLGQVTEKSLGGVEIQDYAYNIRGQLTTINPDYLYGPCGTDIYNKTFGLQIDYDFGFTMPRYDGSISGIIWRGLGQTTPKRSYGYTYDGSARLTYANFLEYSVAANPSFNPCTTLTGDPRIWNKGHRDYTVSNITYDVNGNMLAMNQKGSTTTAPVTMDQLTYTYQPNSNKLAKVADAIHTDYRLGDFLDGSNAGDDYSYDANGNMISDSNKHIQNITYNEFNQPMTISFANGGRINNIYDGANHLIIKTIKDSTGHVDTFHYWGPFTHKNDIVQYVLHQEGRARYLPDSAKFAYDYFVRDHLGNVRTVVTADVTNTSTYVASHEISASGYEDAVFSNVENVRTDKPASMSPSDLKAARMNGGDSTTRVGTTLLLHVMAGDEFDISAESYYESTGQSNYTTPSNMLSSILGTLTGGITGQTQSEQQALQTINSTMSPDNFNAYESVVDNLTDYSVPRAYINYMVFDEQMNLMPDQCGAVQIGSTSGTWNEIHTPTSITALQSGYVCVYLSNEQLIDVYMDHFVVNAYHGRLIQEQHYYPHGLAINMGQSTSELPNKFKYQTNEHQDELKLNLDNFNARTYDPQLGRFCSVDPAHQFMSGYIGMGNNPSNFTDPMGMQVNGGGPRQTTTSGSSHAGVYSDPEAGLPHNGIIWMNGTNAYGVATADVVTSQGQGQTFISVIGDISGSGSIGPFSFDFNNDNGAHLLHYSYKLPGEFVDFYNEEAKMREYIAPVEESAFVDLDKKWNLFETAGKINYAAAVLGAGAENLSGISRFTKSLKIYRETPAGYVFHGNQYVKTFSVAKAGRAAGIITAVIGTAIDGIGLYNYYNAPASDKDAFRVSPQKFSLNATMTGYGFTGFGTIPSLMYFGIDAVYPGGMPAALDQESNIMDQNRQIVPNWRNVETGE